jgi:hypothetical protein
LRGGLRERKTNTVCVIRDALGSKGEYRRTVVGKLAKKRDIIDFSIHEVLETINNNVLVK